MKKRSELLFVYVFTLAFLTACVADQIQPSEPTAAVEATKDPIGDDSGIELTPSVTEETSAQDSQIESGVTVTYVGNSGFLITTSHKKILIDAVYRGYDSVYLLPEDIQNSLALAEPPFDNVDLILVSHSHRDHFDSGLVKQLLQNDPETVFASQTRIASQFSTLPNQIVYLDPAPGEPVQADIDGIHVEALALPHGADQPGNIGFVITVDNIKIFFSGDMDLSQVSFEEFRAYELPEQNIDLAFLTHYYFTSDESEQRFIKEGIAAKYLFPIHYFFTDPPINRTSILNNYPDAILFNKELTSWEMP
jgi:L-ascorbate metabolism protein UlaG (beta-lactamase superfamily)